MPSGEWAQTLILSIVTRADGFLTWWGRELRAVLGPLSLGTRRDADVEVIGVGPGASYFQRVNAPAGLRATLSASEVVEMLRAEGEGRAVALRLSASDALQLQTEIPSRAFDHVREVLALEIETATPFAPEEVTFDFLAEADSGAGVRRVRQFIVKNEFLEKLGDLFRRSGIEVSRIEVEGALGINLLPAEFRRRRRTSLRAEHIAALAALIVLATGGFVGQGRAIHALEARKNALVNETAAVRAAASEANAAAANITRLQGQYSSNPSALSAMASLTQALDDSVWLTELTVAGGTVSISGRAASASKALAAIEASPAFEAAEFTSTVFTDQATNTETFAARMKVQPPASSPPATESSR
ncbi:MAG TPA: hypothetical protein DEA40_15130 [Parvularcula sp.]|nr:hypothetical protein [Parvularcula sp.]